MTPTQKTLKWLRASGWLAEVVERWNHFARRRQDLFGFVDIVAVRENVTWLVQCTSQAGVSARKRKILDHPHSSRVHNGLTRFVAVVGWRKGDARNPSVALYPFTEAVKHID